MSTGNHPNAILTLAALLVASITLTTTPANATVIFMNGYTGTPAEVGSATELAYAADVSDSDLIEGMVPTQAGWNGANGASANELTDGIHGVSFADAGNSVEGAWSNPGATVEYALGTGANGLGYDITSIQTIAAWVNTGGFIDQAWTIDVQAVGGSYLTLATVDFNQPGEGGATKVTLSSLNATGIEAIRFTAQSVDGGANGGSFIPREIDVFGTSTVAVVPEPATFAMAIVGLVGLGVRRRSRRRG